ncbi:crocetin glucosyltransferase, chloroplastic-like [Momordica charantia]|uniref:Mogroside I-E synthase n=1 Tax=Momordica charantia TaxID=3673 RepID=A0A6J1D1I9_MOMCH|nr:crocetin glucosyltransferase, chloroplastic-like [Momordica charantia]
MMRNKNHHFLLICFPSQGYINPSLQLAIRLANLGVAVTFATTVTASRRMNKTEPPPSPSPRLSFATFSDGFDDETLKPNANDLAHYFSELNRCGSQSMTDLITSSAHNGRPITFVIYSLLLSWAADVASTFGIASSLFFAQPATVLALYYYYFHGHGDAISTQLLQKDPSFSIQLPGLPSLTARDFPSFFSPSGPLAFFIPLMREQLEFLGRQGRARVLVNTFHTLEGEALGAIGELKMVAVGPLIQRGSIRGDLFQVTSEDYIEWLSSKAESSVIYISFGSICVLSDQQEEEIVGALFECGYTFLWVIRSKENEDQEEEDERIMKKFGGKGKIVRWCDQVQVLSHPSLGCFVTHCGWNSTLESLVYGVLMVGFPQQVDQATNAKLVEDVWRTGVRVKPNAKGIVERGEIRRCLDIVMGDTSLEKRGEMERNVKKWKELAREAIGEGGSSDVNLESFVMEIDGDGCI